jgi:hypothetical protein
VWHRVFWYTTKILDITHNFLLPWTWRRQKHFTPVTNHTASHPRQQKFSVFNQPTNKQINKQYLGDYFLSTKSECFHNICTLIAYVQAFDCLTKAQKTQHSAHVLCARRTHRLLHCPRFAVAAIHTSRVKLKSQRIWKGRLREMWGYYNI